MSTELTTKAQVKADAQIQLPQIVLQIDGVTKIFGIGTISKYVRVGDVGLVIGENWTIGGLNAREEQLDVIDLAGSSNTISQQLLQDRGGTSSVPSIQISLIDKNGYITELITPGLVVDDILGRKASVYLGYQDTAWPQDFVRIFAGIIDEVVGGASIVLNVASPEQKKRVEIFQQITTELTQDANYRSAAIQGNRYKSRYSVPGVVDISYIPGGTQGSEEVLIAGTHISVKLQPGVSRARDVRDAIENSIEALSLVSIDTISNQANLIQEVQLTTLLGSDATLYVTSTKGMLLPVPSEGLRTYVRVEDEVIEYTGLTGTTITGCVRSAFELIDARSRGDTHEAGTTVDTFYRLQGQAIDIALKILLSGGPEYYANNVAIKSFVEVQDVGTIPNGVWFEGINVQDAWGLTVNDKMSITGSAESANNVSGVLVSDIITTQYGSYVIVDPTVILIPEIITGAMASFASKWNVFPVGAGLEMGGDEIDVPEFERIRGTFSSSLFIYDFYLKETVNAKEFIDTEILFPTGAFSLPRRGKVSVGYTSPPIGGAGLKVLDSSNTTRPDQTKIKRSINKNFYNNILFKFNEAVVDDLFLSGDLEVQQDSKNRIPVGNKTLVIKARGLRPSNDGEVIMGILKRRFSDKYKYGAELVSTTAFYGKTFNTDVGDIIVFGDPNLQLPDTKKGSRAFSPRLFEVSNKSLSIKTGEVRLELLDSGYSLLNGRYGIISPSSLVGVAQIAGRSSVKVKTSYETQFPQLERSKWTPFIKQKVIIHDNKWNLIHETILLGFSPSDNYLMLFKTPIPFAVSENFVIEIAQYPENNDSEDMVLLKRVFGFTNPTVTVTSGIDQLSFTVALADAPKFLEKAILQVRDVAWDIVAPEVNVLSVVGNVITVSVPLGFIPTAGMEIDLIGFKDGGAPYRYL